MELYQECPKSGRANRSVTPTKTVASRKADTPRGNALDKPTQKRLQREAERLIREGKMPSLEEVCATVLETRKEFAIKIRRTHREAREAFVPKPN